MGASLLAATLAAMLAGADRAGSRNVVRWLHRAAKSGRMSSCGGGGEVWIDRGGWESEGTWGLCVCMCVRVCVCVRAYVRVN